jgi:hypothetical protein
LYAVHHNSGVIETLDPLTGIALTSTQVTLSGANVSGLWGLAQNPSTGTYFTILNRTELMTINPATGVLTDIGPTGHNVGGITFRLASGVATLYMVSGNSDATNPDTLFTLNTTTGAATLVLAFGDGNQGETIAFNPVDGLLYRAYGSGAVNVNQFLVKIDPVSLTVTNLPLTGDPYNQATSLTHWVGNYFLMADHSSNLFIVTNAGLVKQLSALNNLEGDDKGMVFAGTAPACPPLAPLYGAASQGPTGPGLFYSVSPTTGAATLIGPIGFEGIGGIRFNATGTLYGAGKLEDGTNTPVMFTINPCTGAGTEIGPTNLGSQNFSTTTDISFRRSDGTLFGFLSDGVDFNGLATFNSSTGSLTSVLGTYPIQGGGGLAFSPAGVLYNAYGDNLETLNSATGAMSLVGAFVYPSPIVEPGTNINAMDFQPSTGTLFGSVAATAIAAPAIASPIGLPNSEIAVSESLLAMIDTSDATVTVVGPTQTGLDAIAFTPQIPATIQATGGAPQTTVVNTLFGFPLQATVTDSNSNPVPGVTVTFTPPATGATAAFAGNVTTAITNSSGIAKSVAISANIVAGGPYNIAATVLGVSTPANFSLTNTAGPPAAITATGGTPQTATVTTAFASPFQATVKDQFGNLVPNVTITFVPPGTGASGTFAGGTSTATTNSSGVATSAIFTANVTSGGPYNVIATFPSVGDALNPTPSAPPPPASYSLTNVDFAISPATTTQTVTAGATANYSFNFTAVVGNTTNSTAFICQGLPLLSSCLFTPATLPANSGNTPFTLAISTTSTRISANIGFGERHIRPLVRLSFSKLLLFFASLWALLILFSWRAFKSTQLRLTAVGLFAALLLFAGFFAGCGGTALSTQPGTPPGNYTITVVATSGSVQRTSTVALVVE